MIMVNICYDFIYLVVSVMSLAKLVVMIFLMIVIVFFLASELSLQSLLVSHNARLMT